MSLGDFLVSKVGALVETLVDLLMEYEDDQGFEHPKHAFSSIESRMFLGGRGLDNETIGQVIRVQVEKNLRQTQKPR